MTALPSSRFKLKQRGKIELGYFADLVLLDPETVIDTASYVNPQSEAIGIEKVWVNGKLSFQENVDENALANMGRAGVFLARGELA